MHSDSTDSAETLIAKIYVSAGQMQSFQQLMGQENEGGLHYTSDITLPKVKYFLLSTGLEKNPKQPNKNPTITKKYPRITKC